MESSGLLLFFSHVLFFLQIFFFRLSFSMSRWVSLIFHSCLSCRAFSPWAPPLRKINIRFNYMSCCVCMCVIKNRTSDLSCQYDTFNALQTFRNDRNIFFSHLINIQKPMENGWIHGICVLCLLLCAVRLFAYNYYHYVYYFN